MVVRSANAAERDERGVLAPAIRELAAEVRDLAPDPGTGWCDQQAVNGVLKAAQLLRSDDRVHDARPDSPLTVPLVAIRSGSADIMVFVGFDADQAAQAIRSDGGDVRVPAPAPTSRRPFVAPWHLLNLPTGSGVTRLRRQLGALDREIRRLSLQLERQLAASNIATTVDTQARASSDAPTTVREPRRRGQQRQSSWFQKIHSALGTRPSLTRSKARRASDYETRAYRGFGRSRHTCRSPRPAPRRRFRRAD